MAITDQCVHGALLGACLYCAIGSKSISDISDRLHVMDVARQIQIGRDNKIAIEAAIEQRNTMLQATNEIGAYLDVMGPIDELDHSGLTEVLSFMIRRIRGALVKVHELQEKVDNPRKV